MTKEARTANIGLAVWWLKGFHEVFVQGSTLGILLSFCTKNRHITKSENISSKLKK